MALRNPKTAPAFETEEDTVVIEAEQTIEAEKDIEPVAKPVTAVPAVKASNAVAKPTRKFSAALQELEGAIDTDTVRGLGVGSLPKVTVSRAGFEIGDEVIGNVLDIEILSFNNRYVLTPGVDGEAAVSAIRISYDRETVENEACTPQEYLQQLKEEGYPNPEMKTYIDIWAILIAKDGKTIPEEDRPMVQVQLSPQSVKTFKAFQMTAGVVAARYGNEISPLVRLSKENAEYKTNRYAVMKFSAVK